jgi:hypothetical protein
MNIATNIPITNQPWHTQIDLDYITKITRAPIGTFLYEGDVRYHSPELFESLWPRLLAMGWSGVVDLS